MRAERRCLPAALRAFAVCAGGRADRAEALARAMVAAGAGGLVSFGLAGGLDPTLPTGALVLADAVVLPDGRAIGTDPEWRAAVAAALGDRGLAARDGRVAGRDSPALTPGDKAGLADRVGALAVDMESHAVARVAAAAGVPLLVLRAVGDPADRAVPAFAMAGLAPDGRTRAAPVLRGLLRHPGALPALLALARDTRRGLRALRRAAPALTAYTPGPGSTR